LPGAHADPQALAGPAAALPEADPALSPVPSQGVGAGGIGGVGAGAGEDRVPGRGRGDVERLAAGVGEVDRGSSGDEVAADEDMAAGVDRGPGLVLEPGHGAAAVLVHEAADG